MAGAQIRCADFEGADKSGSPISAVLSIVFCSAFSRKPRGRMSLSIARLLGRSAAGIEAAAEAALLSVKYDEPVGYIPSQVVAHLLPFIKKYQAELLSRTGVANEYDAISFICSSSTGAKYGSVHDSGWHLLCLHDLVPACEVSVKTQKPVEVEW